MAEVQPNNALVSDAYASALLRRASSARHNANVRHHHMANDAQIDAEVLSSVTVHWQKVAMVAATAMARLNVPIADEAMFERVCCRVEALVNRGAIDSQGNVSMPRHSEVRLRAARGDA